MSFEACAALVERGDPPRFRAAMAAPVAARRVLFPLYAFNLEVARAPWVTSEPMITEMRLQWWRDVLDEIAGDGPVRRHEVTEPLADVLDAQGARDLDRLIAARRWDVYPDAFEDAVHLDDYIDATAGGLMWTGARLLGAENAESTVRDLAFGAGVAAFLQAVPTLEQANRKPLIDGTRDGVAALARRALDRFDRGRAAQRELPQVARAAILPAWQARPLLTMAVRDPGRVADGALQIGPIADRLRLARAAMTGRV
ncbi:squalene/phytoene synthase family protein [Loktanella sp. SALINAS62]|uniref:squalene/phytoene synthase family protein n=1 Tax=Loktanella sp. SALINAS62 TaxID=2706124 RepID=UPI001B8B3266|nr:squalene/phytoene synthase family protein [Loktanella sp. SALINAS62]MBS1303704.1 squalene/phytoene synthase family protein [Loktanella sp. SALINAS62]